MRPLAQFVLAVAACLLLSTTAHARTIDACVMKNGILKVLDEGAECLPQETPITLGQAQAAVESVRVFDGEGRDIGAFLDQQNGVVRVLLADLGVIARINTAGISPRHPLNGHPDIIFGLAGCDGPGYVGAYWSNTLFPSPQSRDVWLVGATCFPSEEVGQLSWSSLRDTSRGLGPRGESRERPCVLTSEPAKVNCPERKRP